jgi:hypothetical protein
MASLFSNYICFTHEIELNKHRRSLLYIEYRENGGCGYVLKAACLLGEEGFTAEKPVKLSIRVLSGQQLPKPKGEASDSEVIDPYVVMKVFGVEADNAEFKTKTINNNGLNPMWNETFSATITSPSLAMLHFSVYDQDLTSSTFIGCYSLPLSTLRTGIRSLPLLDAKNKRLDFASLLCQFAYI